MPVTKLPRRNRYSRETVRRVDAWLQARGIELLWHAPETSPLAAIAADVQRELGGGIFRSNLIGRRLHKVWPRGLYGWRGETVNLGRYFEGLTSQEWGKLRNVVRLTMAGLNGRRVSLRALAVVAVLAGCAYASEEKVLLVCDDKEGLCPPRTGGFKSETA